MKTNINIKIIPYTETLKTHIKTLNYEWLNKYFRIEPKDEIVLSNPTEAIINTGGYIFYAAKDEEIVGTFSLLYICQHEYELSKMAVKEGTQGLGIGQLMMTFAVDFAKQQNFKSLILYSNRSLKPAIHLYEKFGFEEIPLESGVYERADIKMMKII
ncbi:GNAT family N-acetyltransferase [Flavobacterium branchiophilum NBRC 15030 = ATCC 35035]|uniref:Acetyltransferase (GNAT) family protein n=1 Tax=Flavobacterium branchiophilum TaxID=55197 RepID=A0A543G0R2_9FLAO|nr:GNAT family N-acetyltransferase [Flavobacterium branchiophilum]OXA72653.1 GNAT family N-acetyltransferase [Flavobacterium branchiophilum NBRC 15030 = ATCC 35035]TQM39657.1 acetyltransferase (GNAT) family protein [Flavobacterium branchiophilum]GEM55693.1 hypothetical protein FB1_19140 [Flavobacterium branchiophilum NBRC 15030 = ATCC 35035]